ncbi:hypothetical protein Tco_0366247 [Tanacetum coccineum]
MMDMPLAPFTTCLPFLFLITAEFIVIYMHQFLATIVKHKASYRFKIDNKRFSVNVKVFRDILNICTRIPGQEFDEPPTVEEALFFIRELSHSGEIKYITDVIVDHLHQPWRTFASIINKCLCGNVSGLDKIRLSRVQILWGMYYKKNLDFIALIWEDLAYLIDNKDSKKQDKITDFESGVPNKQQRKTSDADKGTAIDDNSDEVTKDDDEDDVESDVNDDKEASDSEKTYSDEDENLNLNPNDDEEEEKEEEDVRTPNSFEFNDDDEEYDKLHKDVNVSASQEKSYEQVIEDTHVTLTSSQKTEGSKQSTSISSNFASKFLNLDNVPPV